jgi:hypothetical protein
MKQLLTFQPTMNPAAGTLDFSTVPNFDINKLYAVINITQNQPIYVPGAPGLGYSAISGDGKILTLQWTISSYGTGDLLNVYYDVPDGQITNAFLAQIAETLTMIHREIAVQTHILSEGLNIREADIDDLRNADFDQ